MKVFDPCETHRGRMNSKMSCSNGENSIPPEFEKFSEGTPRAPMPAGGNLSVMSINMYENMNKAAHHTAAFKFDNLIIRRGQEFIMGIVFNRPFNKTMDLFFVEFLIGDNPIRTQKSLISLTIGGDNQANDWKTRVVETRSSETQLGITPNADCIVGLYSTYVTVISGPGKQRTQRNQTTDFYLLFNPWAPMDQVYLDNEEERQEYVLNDVGMIYIGDHNNIGRRPWNYGQFQSTILQACIFILDFGKMPLQYRGDAVKVVRKASSMINSQDDDGVLVGSWGGDFSFGTAPTAWTGSAEILYKYFLEGGVPVKYGQCWVYAGVFNTFLRCLGLPARVITNFCSAHDNSGNMTTDIVLDEDGRLDSQVSDTIWNYHCWNEVFLKRSDMPSNYSGWQVVDSTPQQISEGYYRCGPTAVAAVKDEALGFSFDARFVFAEVSSDVVYYKRDKYGNMSVIYVDKDYVGKLVLTKMIDSNDHEDITDSYKHAKRVSRRQTNMQELGSGVSGSSHAIPPDTDVQLNIQVTKKNNDVMLTMTFNNLCNEPRNIECKITGKVQYYTGATRTRFISLTCNVALQDSESKQEIITVTADEYKNFIIGQSFLCFLVYAFIEETAMSLTTIKSIYLDTPSLYLEVSKPSQVGMDMFATVGFTNTLDDDLTNVTVRMEGLNLFSVKTKTYRVIQPGSQIQWIESFKPHQAGTMTLVACLDCSTLRNVCGHLDIEIQPRDS